MPTVGLAREEIEAPKGVSVSYKDGVVTVKGKGAALTRRLSHPRIKIEAKGNKVSLSCVEPKRREAAVLGTFRAHIENMVHGAHQQFEYKMKILYSHFPIKTSVKGDKFVVENFLGEKFPRNAKIVGDTKIAVKGDEVTLTGSDVECVGQSAANIERATHIKDRDLRIFQDGIFITRKGGRK
jgi:large subunit ribosomal protein L6